MTAQRLCEPAQDPSSLEPCPARHPSQAADRQSCCPKSMQIVLLEAPPAAASPAAEPQEASTAAPCPRRHAALLATVPLSEGTELLLRPHCLPPSHPLDSAAEWVAVPVVPLTEVRLVGPNLCHPQRPIPFLLMEQGLTEPARP